MEVGVSNSNINNQGSRDTGPYHLEPLVQMMWGQAWVGVRIALHGWGVAVVTGAEAEPGGTAAVGGIFPRYSSSSIRELAAVVEGQAAGMSEEGAHLMSCAVFTKGTRRRRANVYCGKGLVEVVCKV